MKELASRPGSEDATGQTDQAERTMSFRAKALTKVLERQPYGKELLDEAMTLFNINSELQFLLLMSSDVNAKEIPDILDRFDNPGLRDLLRPLSP
jgi:hypothetical protein